MARRFLPCVSQGSLDRRQVLALAGAAVAGCGTNALQPPLEDASVADEDASVVDVPRADATMMPDASADAARDATMPADVRDASTDESVMDTGTDAGRDAADAVAMDARGDAGVDAASDARDAGGGVDVARDCGVPGRLAGALGMFPRGTWRLVRAIYVIVARDAGGLYAYSAACTHQGCVLYEPDARGVAACTCHASSFDGNGAVLTGPATRPLQHFAVAVCAGEVYVDTATRVAANVRLAVA
jgi:Rieske Fe-S protein